MTLGSCPEPQSRVRCSLNPLSHPHTPICTYLIIEIVGDSQGGIQKVTKQSWNLLQMYEASSLMGGGGKSSALGNFEICRDSNQREKKPHTSPVSQVLTLFPTAVQANNCLLLCGYSGTEQLSKRKAEGGHRICNYWTEIQQIRKEKSLGWSHMLNYSWQRWYELPCSLTHMYIYLHVDTLLDFFALSAKS